MGVSEYNKDIAKYALSIIGGKPQANSYIDSGTSATVDIGVFRDTGYEGVLSYATFGLSNFSLGLIADDKEVRVELLGAAYEKFEFAPNILSACAFNILNGQYSIKYGTIYPNIIEEYYPDSDMKHILFDAPYMWDGFGTLEYPDRNVVWLMAIPVSDNEFNYAAEHGVDALIDLIERENIDPLDLYRKSIK